MQLFKTGYCVDCEPGTGERKLYDKVRCSYHYWQNKKTHKGGANISTWFDYHIKNSGNICENCGAVLFFSSMAVAKSCQAHILPKKVFGSVKGDLDNHMTLGGMEQECNCHAQFDSSWSNACKMPVITLARERLEKFRGRVSESQLDRYIRLVYNEV